MIANMNQEDYEFLKNFEYHLGTALNSNYCRLDAKNTLSQIAAIYERTFSTKSKIIGGCNRCALNDIKRLARAYFDYKATEKPVEAPATEESVTTPETTQKPATAKKTTKKTTKKK